MILAAWHVLVQLAPWLLLGTAIAGLLHALLPAGLIHRRLRGRSGVVQAVALGVPLPLCSCGVIPAGIGLKRDGASNGAAIGFLISTPQTGVDSVLLSASFLGWPFALFKVATAAITGIVGGLLADALAVKPDPDIEQSPTFTEQSRRGWRDALDHGLEVVHSIWIWLVIGVFVSAAIEILIPAGVLTRFQDWGSLPAAFAALVISLPLYVCAVASVPIAGALVANGLPAGAALVFLMAGPATNVATMGAILRAFGRRILLAYLATIILGSVGAAMTFDWLLPGQVDIAKQSFHEHGGGWFSQASALLLVALFVWFAFQDVSDWWRRRTKTADLDEGGIRVEVQGMTCNNCVNRLETALRAIDGVRSAHVQLEPGQAVIHGNIDEPQVRQAIRDSGFEPVGA